MATEQSTVIVYTPNEGIALQWDGAQWRNSGCCVNADNPVRCKTIRLCPGTFEPGVPITIPYNQQFANTPQVQELYTGNQYPSVYYKQIGLTQLTVIVSDTIDEPIEFMVCDYGPAEIEIVKVDPGDYTTGITVDPPSPLTNIPVIQEFYPNQPVDIWYRLIEPDYINVVFDQVSTDIVRFYFAEYPDMQCETIVVEPGQFAAGSPYTLTFTGTYFAPPIIQELYNLDAGEYPQIFYKQIDETSATVVISQNITAPIRFKVCIPGQCGICCSGGGPYVVEQTPQGFIVTDNGSGNSFTIPTP